MKTQELSADGIAIRPLPEVADVTKWQSSRHEIIIDLDVPGEDLDIERLYEARVKQYPLLDAGQEIELAKQVEAGLYAGYKLLQAQQTDTTMLPALRRDLRTLEHEGFAAKEQLIASNLRLVMKLARKYKFRLPFMDAVQCGNIGLMTAVEKFDYTRGVPFRAIASLYIRGAIRDGRRSSYGFELSKGEIEDLDKLRIAENAMLATPEGPSLAGLAKETDLKPKRIKKLNGLTQTLGTWDAPAYRDSTRILAEVVSDEGPESDLFRASDGISSATDEILAIMEDPATYDDELHAEIMRLRWGLHDGRLRTRAQVVETLGLDMTVDTLGKHERKAGKRVIGALIDRGYDLDPTQTFYLNLRIGGKVS